MEFVIDNNCLQSEKLSTFLEESKSNIAVISDFTIFEIFKSENTYQNIWKSFEIISQYPSQFLFLKSPPLICKSLKGRDDWIYKSLMDNFQIFCDWLYQATKVPPSSPSKAKQYFDWLIARSIQISNHKSHYDHASFESIFTSKNLAFIRANPSTYPFWLMNKIRSFTLDGYLHAIRQDCIVDICKLQIPYTSTALYREQVAKAAFAYIWIRSGNSPTKKDFIFNHTIDYGIVSIATLFDGLISSDGKVNEAYERSMSWLNLFNNEFNP